ncbi:MAG: VanZ family protein [bacterium]
MRRIIHIFLYWLPPFIWMGVVFFMSSQKSVKMTTNVTTDFVTFKTLHMVEYAFLFFLFYRAFQSLNHIQKNVCGICAFAVAIFYSLTDELHQLYIPTRQGRFRDIAFDIAGMIVMYVIIKKVRLIQKLL